MNKKYLLYIVAFLILLSTFLSWFSIDAAIRYPDSSDWIAPIFWFSASFISLSIGIVLIRNFWALSVIFGLSFLWSLIFSFNLWHLVPISLAFMLMHWAALRIREDMNLNIKIDLWKSIRVGRILIILAFSLVITSQFYFEVRDSNPQDLIPRLQVGDETSKVIISNILPRIIPGFEVSEESEKEGLTVDEFILESQKAEISKREESLLENEEDFIKENFGDISPSQREAMKDQLRKESALILNNQKILEGSRKELSEFVGMELEGDEKVSSVLSEMVNNRIANFFSTNDYSADQFPFLPAALSVGLFLTVFSLGSFFSPLWMFLANLLFIIMVKSKIIKVDKIPTEQEVIA